MRGGQSVLCIEVAEVLGGGGKGGGIAVTLFARLIQSCPCVRPIIFIITVKSVLLLFNAQNVLQQVMRNARVMLPSLKRTPCRFRSAYLTPKMSILIGRKGEIATPSQAGYNAHYMHV